MVSHRGVVFALLSTVSLPAQYWRAESGLPSREGTALAWDLVAGVLWLFGGDADSPGYDDTWRYTPAGGWQQLRCPTSPQGRSGHAIAADPIRQRIVLFGGRAGPRLAPTASLGDTWEFDGNTWREVVTAHRPSPRYGHGLVAALSLRTVLLVGGETGVTPVETWRFDGIDWQPVITPHTPSQSSPAVAYSIPRARTVMFTTIGTPAQAMEVWEFDGLDWQLIPAVHTAPRTVESCTADLAGNVLTLGGHNPGAPLGDTWAWTGTTWRSVPAPSIVPGLPAATLAFDTHRQRALAVAGRNTWEFDGTSWSVVAGNRPLLPLFTAAYCYDSNRGRLLAIGSGPNGGPVELRTWNGQSWSLITNTPVPRGHPSATFDPQRDVLLVLVAATTQHVWEHDGATWVQIPGPPTPNLHISALCHDPVRRATVAFAVVDPGSPQARTETWAWNGTTWTWIPSALQPPLLPGGAFFYDRVRDTCMLHGAASNETWELTRQGWTRLNPQTLPAPGYPDGAHDATSGSALLSTPLGEQCRPELVTFDGTQWQPMVTNNLPPCPYGGSLLFDTVRHRLLLVSREEVWHLERAPVARFLPMGPSCGPTTPRLVAAPGTTPQRGTVWPLQVTGLPPAAGALWLQFGFGISTFAGAGLPAPLLALGLPDCLLWIEPDAGGRLLIHNGNSAQTTLPLPNGAALAGQHFALQAFGLDPTTTAGVGFTTNAGVATIW